MSSNTKNEQSMAKKTMIYFAGNFSSKVFGMIIIPIYASYLTASELGIYDYQLTIGNLLMPILALAIWESILRFGLNAEGVKLKRVLSTSIIIATTTIFLSIIILMTTYISLYGYSLATFLYVIMIGTMPIITLLNYSARALKKNIVFVQAGIISSFVNMISIVLFVMLLKKGLIGLLISTILANFFNVLFLIFGSRLPDYVSLQYFDKKEATRLLRFSIPLILNLTFNWFISGFSRFYINLEMGAAANGVFAFASKFSGILTQFAGIVNMSAIEDAILAKNSPNFILRFEKNVESITNLMFRICFVLLPVITLYYYTVENKDFLNSLNYVPLLLLVALLTSGSTLIGNIFQVFDKTGKVFLTTMLAAFVNIIFSIILGPLLGVLGVVLAQVLSGFTIFLSRYFMGQRVKSYNYNWKQFIINITLLLIISTICLNTNIIVNVFLFIIVGIYFLYFYVEWILNQLKKFLKRR